MKLDQYLSRPVNTKSLLLIIAIVLMAVSYFAFSAPPRGAHRPARHGSAARPAPAHRPARYHAPGTPVKKSHPRRIGTLRPVVIGGGGTIVVKEDEDGVQVVEVPAETTETAGESQTQAPASTGETMHDTKTSAASGVPSDADNSMADSPRYEVIGVEDNGLTIVVDVDRQETKIRMIGLAEAPRAGAGLAYRRRYSSKTCSRGKTCTSSTTR